VKVNRFWSPPFNLSFIISAVSAGIGLGLGILAGIQPFLLGLLILSVVIVVCFFTYFEQTVLGLLILRSSLDIFSAQQIPALFAIGLDALAICYVVLTLLMGRTVITDWFFWFFAAWVAIQGLWVVLLPLGGLGLDASHLSTSIREWARLFSWLMAYLLVMQLKRRIHPEKLISCLFLSLILPVAVAFSQVLLPASVLPPMLIYGGREAHSLTFEVGSRLNGTFGHPNSFATFLLFSIGLTCWKLRQTNHRWLWIFLLSILVFFIVSTKALFILLLLSVFFLVLITPNLNWLNFLGILTILTIMLGLYASSSFGWERLSSISNTLLLNSDLDISQSILLSWKDSNSFNWRIAQWTFLVQAWQHFPLLGYGLQSSSAITMLTNYAHNDYIRALAETGIVGFILFILFLAVQFIRLLKLSLSLTVTNAQRHFCWVLISILIALLIGMLTENIWSQTTLFFYWWTCFTIAFWDWSQPKINH